MDVRITQTIAPAAPRWLPRPDGTGWWVGAFKHGTSVQWMLINVTESDLSSDWPNWHENWFGPIPEPPKEPSDE